MIRPTAVPATDWLDACCWSCGTVHAIRLMDGRLLCAPCREELSTEPPADPIHLARHAYWESHALGWCWRCMARPVDPDDDVGLCSSCRHQLDRQVSEGAA